MASYYIIIIKHHLKITVTKLCHDGNYTIVRQNIKYTVNVFTFYFFSNTAANRVNPRENIMLRVLKSKWRTLAQKWYLKLWVVTRPRCAGILRSAGLQLYIDSTRNLATAERLTLFCNWIIGQQAILYFWYNFISVAWCTDACMSTLW